MDLRKKARVSLEVLKEADHFSLREGESHPGLVVVVVVRVRGGVWMTWDARLYKHETRTLLFLTLVASLRESLSFFLISSDTIGSTNDQKD